MTPSLGSINLLDLVTELGETLYLHLQACYKDIVKDTDEHTEGRCGRSPAQELCPAELGWDTLPACAQALVHLPASLSVFSCSEALRPCAFGFLWRPHHTGMTEAWTSVGKYDWTKD
jgi:hypothetical protein